MKGTIRRACTAGLTPFVTPSPARSRACTLHQSCSMQTFVVLMQTPSGFSQAPALILTFWLLHCWILCMSPKKQWGFCFFLFLFFFCRYCWFFVPSKAFQGIFLYFCGGVDFFLGFKVRRRFSLLLFEATGSVWAFKGAARSRVVSLSTLSDSFCNNKRTIQRSSKTRWEFILDKQKPCLRFPLSSRSLKSHHDDIIVINRK